MTGSAVFYQRAMQGSGFDSFQNVIIKIGTFLTLEHYVFRKMLKVFKNIKLILIER